MLKIVNTQSFLLLVVLLWSLHHKSLGLLKNISSLWLRIASYKISYSYWIMESKALLNFFFSSEIVVFSSCISCKISKVAFSNFSWQLLGSLYYMLGSLKCLFLKMTNISYLAGFAIVSTHNFGYTINDIRQWSLRRT